MEDKEDYLTSYRKFFEEFAATVNPNDQLPVHIVGYTITEAEMPGEILYWTTQYLTERECPKSLMIPLQRIILDEVKIESKKQPHNYGFNAEVYIPLRLMLAVTAKVNEVCLRYLDNSLLDSLPPPPSSKLTKTSIATMKNSRRSMEDRHVEISNLEELFGLQTSEPTSFYAVYDGHAGSAAAIYCAAHLHQYLVESPHFTTDLNKALIDAYVRTDAEFVEISEVQRVRGGSTAVTICVRGRTLIAAWAGDSQALLAKRMELMQLVNPHKPDRKDEQERIHAAGGKVMFWGIWRVNGQLGVSRAIGDADYKPYVSAMPEMISIDLDGDEDFVVIACDGLWDFASEDRVALSVYMQLAANHDDLKKVTLNLLDLAKQGGSGDNVTVIVVFLKEPRLIAAENRPPMELGLDNPLANPPPFAVEEACKAPPDLATNGNIVDDGASADNGIDHSDSDSEDLGPETAVDIDDLDADSKQEPAPPTPPAHAVEEGHVDPVLVDNVAESGDDSDDEWNYYKGEGDRERNEQVAAEDNDEPPRSETPCQDNSAWESSSVDMNSSPLNPDAPVFIPCGTSGSEVLLAESPYKPLPMDDAEQPDMEKFVTEVLARPNELQDLDNSDQLNGHHNKSISEASEELLNGNEKSVTDILAPGFGVGLDSDKVKESLIEDLERIQKDTTDFCNIQVFQAQTETNPLPTDIDEELFERLKNKERDPMSMSFYQEKDDDTCERLGAYEPPLDLNAVHPLPDAFDDDSSNDFAQKIDFNDKENTNPERIHVEMEQQFEEPNNDIIKFDDKPVLANNAINLVQGDNINDYNIAEAMDTQNLSNIDFECSNVPQEVLQTDTPESHKLLFEQIPEIPDGKTSELGYTGDDTLDPSEEDREVRPLSSQDESSQDYEMESKTEDHPAESEFEQLPTQTQALHNPFLENFDDIESKPIETSEPFEQTKPNENIPEVTHSEIVDELLFNGDFEVHNVEKEMSGVKPEFGAKEEENIIDPCDMHVDAAEPSVMDARMDMLIPEVCDTKEEQISSSLPVEVPFSPKSPVHAPDDINDRLSPAISDMHTPSRTPVLEPEAYKPVPALSPTPIDPIKKPIEFSVLTQSEIEQFTDKKNVIDNVAQNIPQFEDNLLIDTTAEVDSQAGPTPDIVPEQPPSEEKCTPEPITDDSLVSRAQEICVPHTNEIPTEVLCSATPPPTPSATTRDTPSAPPLEDLTPAVDNPPAELILPAAAATVAMAAGVAAAKTTAKKPATSKPSTTMSKSTPKSTATPKTPSSGIKKTTTTASKPSTPASKPSTPSASARPIAAKSQAAKPPTPKVPVTARAPITKTTTTKTAAAPKPAPAKTTTATSKPSTTRPATARPAATTRVPPSAAAPKLATATRISTTAKAPTATAQKVPAAPRPAPRTTTTTRPTTARAPEKKPLANGDVKAPVRKVPAAGISARAAAPRPTPRTTTTTAASAAKSNGAPRAPIQKISRPTLDKQSKDLANKRITSTARTAPTKTSLSAKTGTVKTAVKKPEPQKMELTNGDLKSPPSPTADNALLPDVIA